MVTREELGEILPTLIRDRQQENPPFDDFDFGTSYVDIQGDQDLTMFLTFLCTVNKGENSKWIFDTCEELWNTEHWLFKPKSLIEDHTLNETKKIFETAGFRYWSQKADAWYTIAETLYTDFDSNPLNLLEETDYDAPQLLNYIQNVDPNGFPQIKGPKLSSTWIKYLDREVQELKNLNQIPIAADLHIVEVTNKLLGTSYSPDSPDDKEQVRQFWHDLCMEYDVAPMRVDQALWRIHRNWDNYGEAYLKRLLENN